MDNNIRQLLVFELNSYFDKDIVYGKTRQDGDRFYGVFATNGK